MDYANPARPDERLSNDDRSNALAALATHQTDGRISADEYTQRAETVSNAKTWGDLAAPFADLPRLTGDGSPHGDASGIAGAGSAPGAAGIGGGLGGAPGTVGFGNAGVGSPGPTASEPSPAASRPAPYGGYGSYGRRGRHPLGGRAGVAIVSATPLVAVLLFFITGMIWGFNWSWLWFLLVPIVGAIVYAPSWYDPDDR